MRSPFNPIVAGKHQGTWSACGEHLPVYRHRSGQVLLRLAKNLLSNSEDKIPRIPPCLGRGAGLRR